MVAIIGGICGSGYIELELETASKNKIPNAQLNEISQFEHNQFGQLEKKYGNFVKIRTNSTPRYNCHGMTFASRRTGIFESQIIYRILSDDKYEEVDSENILPGDVILYFDDHCEIEHSGIVIKTPSIECLMPIVYSKWGKYAELIHPANQCPYNLTNIRYYRIQL